MLRFIVLCVLLFALAKANEILVTFGVPQDSKHPVGIYWAGAPDAPRISKLKPWFGSSDSTELLVNVISPGRTQSEQVFSGSSFVIRSSDLTSRIRVTISKNNGKDRERPFTISLVNMAIEDRNGPFPLEVQHSNAGYIWVDPGDVVEHITGPNHIFTVRDKTKKSVFSVSINGHAKADL